MPTDAEGEGQSVGAGSPLRSTTSSLDPPEGGWLEDPTPGRPGAPESSSGPRDARAGREGLTVGVVVTAYHRRGYLLRALRSVAAGSEMPDRLVLVEDHPPYTDTSSSLLRDLLPGVPGLAVNGGFPRMGHMMAWAIWKCPTDVICCLDDDDAFLPAKVATIRRLLADRPDLGYVRNGTRWVDEDLSPLPMRQRARDLPSGVVAPDPDAWLAAGLDTNSSSLSFRRAPYLPHLEVLGGMPTAPDAGLFWIALRAGLTPYSEAAFLTLRACGMDFDQKDRYRYPVSRRSFQHLVDRSRPGGLEEVYSRYMLRRKTVEIKSTYPWPQDMALRALGLLRRQLPGLRWKRGRRFLVAWIMATRR